MKLKELITKIPVDIIELRVLNDKDEHVVVFNGTLSSYRLLDNKDVLDNMSVGTLMFKNAEANSSYYNPISISIAEGQGVCG